MPKQRANIQTGRQLLPPEDQDHVESCPVALNGKDKQGKLFPKVDGLVSYLGNRGLAQNDTPAMTPTAEVQPLGLVMVKGRFPEEGSPPSYNFL